MIEFIPMSNVDDIAGKIKEYNFVPLKEVSSGYTKFKNRDVIFAKITPCMENGNCAIVSGLTQDICFGSTEFMVFRVYRKLTEKYLHYFLHNDFFRRNAEPFMRGTAGQKRISSHFMATHFFGLPPLEEQSAITNYLDTQTAQIDQKIDLLSQKAIQYGKLKQSLINETVTRGLDKSVPMKDSGVDWIGEVPVDWKLRRLKDIGKSIIGIIYSPDDVLNNDNGVLVLRSSNIQGGKISLLDTVYVNKEISKNQTLKLGDILICSRNGSRHLIGKNICIDERTLDQTFGAFMTVYRSKYFRFISKFLNSNVFESQSSLFGSSTVNQLTINTLNIFLVALPPVSEQQAIATYLDEKTTHIDCIIATINTQIDKLKELRKALINDVVTGKIKVV